MVWHLCHTRDINVLKSKAGLRFRMPAEQVFVSGWENILIFHRLIESPPRSTASMVSECHQKASALQPLVALVQSLIASALGPCLSECENAVYGACVEEPSWFTQFTVHHYSCDEIQSRQCCACHCLLDTSLFRAACRIQGLVHIWT